MVDDWRSDLEQWLEPFVGALGHKTRGRMCPAYVAGLIGPGDRKSVQPMAARDRAVNYDQLHHFVADGVWDAAPLEAALLAEADRQVGGGDAWLIIDDTALPKKGRNSVGVAPQYAGALGKNANCQALVSLTLAQGEVPVAVGLRLFLPESWTGDQARLDRARVPDNRRDHLTKPEIALAEIDRVREGGVRFGCVLADAGYGVSTDFRQGLSDRELRWAVGIAYRQKVYPADVALILPGPTLATTRGRPRQNPMPDKLSVTAQAMLEGAKWQKLSWRKGTKGHLTAHFAAVRVCVADGPRQRIGDMGGQHLPGEKVWLIGEHRSSGERKYYLSNLPADTPLKQLASAIKARWVCEQAHQQLKEELGLDHFEGRSWQGLHRHCLMCMIALAFLQSQRLKQAKGGKKNRRTSPATKPASHTPSHHRNIRAVPANPMPALPKIHQS
jgi:SRSO17 transposase